jgi:hypothetical protein
MPKQYIILFLKDAKTVDNEDEIQARRFPKSIHMKNKN